MSWPRRLSLLIAGLVLLLAPLAFRAGTQAAAEPQSRTDGYGDPLPEGALARIGTTRLVQGDIIRSLAFSPDGRILASAGDSEVLPSGDTESLLLWEAATGKQLGRLTGHRGNVYSIGFSPDGKLLASGG